jgi:DNA-binding transcriptional regulator LsrR (DeoR family)
LPRKPYIGTIDGSRPKSKPRAIAPAQFACDPVLWAAWLYHHDNLTQNQIANVMGISRASVANYLQLAKEQNIVSISVRPDLVQQIEISRELRRKFGLRNALIIPGDGGSAKPAQRIGAAGAAFLLQLLRPRDILGVAWGRTVLALSRVLPIQSRPELTVAQLVGSHGDEEGFSAEQCTLNIATRLGARCISIFAPAIVGRPELREMLMDDPSLREQFATVRACNKALIGVCTVKRNSLIFEARLFSEDLSREYISKGAVGVICGRFFDRKGIPVLGSADNRMIGLTLEELRRIPCRIAVAGGPEKTEAMLGALRGEYITDLVTDEATARSLLETNHG